MRPFSGIYNPDDLMHTVLADIVRYVAYRIVSFLELLLFCVCVFGASTLTTLWITGGLP